MKIMIGEVVVIVKALLGMAQVGISGCHGHIQGYTDGYDQSHGKKLPFVEIYAPPEFVVQYLHYHSIPSGEARRALIWISAILPLLMRTTRSPIAPMAALWVTISTVLPCSWLTSSSSSSMLLPV